MRRRACDSALGGVVRRMSDIRDAIRRRTSMRISCRAEVGILTPFIDSDGFRDAVEDAIMDLVKSECLQRRKEVSNDATESV